MRPVSPIALVVVLPCGTMRPVSPIALVVVLWGASAIPVSAQAHLRWDDARLGTFGTSEIAALAFLSAGAAGFTLFADEQPPRWRGGILFDDDARDALRLTDHVDRRVADSVSDGLLLLLVGWPWADTLGSWAATGDRHLASQLGGVTALSFASVLFLNRLVKRAASRERPYAAGCDGGEPPEVDEGCESPSRSESFYSGHSSVAFTGASLVCAHHTNLPIYGSRPLDLAACASALVLATGTALLRVMADRHYLSDVLVGALAGVLAGFVLPTLLHYDRP